MIQFIITGWHFNQQDTYDVLKQLEDMNEGVSVFFSCHKEPPQNIKDNFDYEVFYNGAEECGAYDQALEHLNLSDETIIFFLHDDLIIKDMEFINICLSKLNEGYKVIGNGRDYADNFDPFKKTDIGIKEEFDGATFKDYVKDETQHLFDSVLQIVKVRPSFICMTAGSVKEMGGFEPRKEAYIPPLTKADEWCPTDEPHYRGTKGLGSYGNLFPALVCYKMNKIFGHQRITWLSDTYVDSPYIYECQRGGISEMHPMRSSYGMKMSNVIPYINELAAVKKNINNPIHWHPSDSWKGRSVSLKEKIEKETQSSLVDLETDSNFYDWKIVVWQDVLNILDKHIIKDNFVVVDLCCGNGFLLHMIKQKYPNCIVVGVDLFLYNAWNDITKANKGVFFTQMSIEEFVKIKPKFTIDIGLTFNTLRGWTKEDVLDIDLSTYKVSRSNATDPRNLLYNWINENCKIKLTNLGGEISWP